MSTRRQFLKQLGLGVAAGAIGLPLIPEPLFSRSAPEPIRGLKIALLADSHLPSACPETAAAQKLMRAVDEINAQHPTVDLVFFAGDLTENGDFKTLELGRRILSSLAAPCWLVPGEQDIPLAANRFRQDTFSQMVFAFAHRGVHFCGCNTSIVNPATGAIDFHFNPSLQRGLAMELAAVPPDTPLLIFTHAPLYRLFQPWQWWTEESESLYSLLESRKNVYLLHGHVHQNITLQHQNLTFQGLRSTAWPLPDVRIGLNAAQPSPGGSDTEVGCGWMLLTIHRNGTVILQDKVWS
jgi:3',5'-cyclic-AMP phosphodiesterase